MKTMTRTWLLLGLAALVIPFAGCGGGGGGGGGGTTCADLRFATVAWRIEDQFGNSLSCQAAGANEVILNFGSFGPYSYACTDYSGTTDSGLPPGNYEFSMQLLAPNGAVLSDTTVNNPPVAYPIYSCAQDDIPDVIFGI
jgi:hypothetical protein